MDGVGKGALTGSTTFWLACLDWPPTAATALTSSSTRPPCNRAKTSAITRGRRCATNTPKIATIKAGRPMPIDPIAILSEDESPEPPSPEGTCSKYICGGGIDLSFEQMARISGMYIGQFVHAEWMVQAQKCHYPSQRTNTRQKDATKKNLSRGKGQVILLVYWHAYAYPDVVIEMLMPLFN
jgi:hypothetical protein